MNFSVGKINVFNSFICGCTVVLISSCGIKTKIEDPIASVDPKTPTTTETKPTALLTGVPTGTNNTTTLGVSVYGTKVSNYKYKVGVSGTTDCTSSTGYSASTVVATSITANISAVADGEVKICVVGGDTSGVWQDYSSATSATWTKDATPPTVTLTGTPTGTNNTTTLAITVGGTGAISYKYKVGVSGSTDCTSSTDYSASTVVATSITDSISALADGTIKICAVGVDSLGNWQAYSSATSATWTKDTAAPTATLSGEPTGTSGITTLAITVGGTGVAAYLYKVGVAGSTDCTSSSGYSASTAVATLITDDISALADGSIKLCVVGSDSA
ncbi:MAG: hypothetical protein ACOYOK_03340, partial [Pseudobdellovibrionaceae bacterium]